MPNPDPSPAVTRQHQLGDEELGKADARPGGNWLRALLDDCRADRVSGVVLASQWLRARVAPTRLEATGPWSTALGRLVLAALLPTPWYPPPLSFTSVAALVFYGGSMLPAALRADTADAR
jgi:hypothetical protein